MAIFRQLCVQIRPDRNDKNNDKNRKEMVELSQFYYIHRLSQFFDICNVYDYDMLLLIHNDADSTSRDFADIIHVGTTQIASVTKQRDLALAKMPFSSLARK